MIHQILSYFRRCAHAHLSWPMTPKGESTYVACLTCGQRFNYDWESMRMGAPIEQPPARQWQENRKGTSDRCNC